MSRGIDAFLNNAAHNTALSLGRASSSANVDPAKKRSRRLGFMCSSTSHVHMPDVIFEVRIGNSAKSEPFVKSLEVHLRSNSDLAAPLLLFDQANAFDHQQVAESGSAYVRMRRNASDRCLRIFHSRREDSGVRNKPPPALTLSPSEHVVRLLVCAISVEIRTILLDDKDFLAQCHRRIEIIRRKILERRA